MLAAREEVVLTIISPAVVEGASDRLAQGTVVRVMSPVGIYWRGSLRDSKALYSGTTDLVFTACHFNARQHEGEYYSEFDDPMIEEVRLLSALSLVIGWDAGVVSFYPHPWSMRLPDFLALEKKGTETALRRLIATRDLSPSYALRTDPPLPFSHGGPEYEFRPAEMPLRLQRRLLRKIDLNDHLMLRGLTTWLKASMLRHHSMFQLEALYSLYVGLDATFSLVRRRLKELGIENPDAWDAGEFLDRAEGREPDGNSYFGDFYVDRIRLMHPDNRFGIVPYPPATVCDVHSLSNALREVFRLLILGKVVNPDNYPRIT